MDRTLERSVNIRRTSTTNRSILVRGGYFDYQTVFLTFVMLMFGVVMVYSSSSYRATINGFSGYYYAKRQVIFAVLGIAVMFMVSHINYRFFAKLSKILMMVSIVLCAYVLIGGESSHGASRWINLGPISFQPSEVAKVGIIIYVSYRCVAEPYNLSSFKGLGNIVILPGICIACIAKENLSTALVCSVCMIAIMFVASPKPWRILVILGAVAVLAVVLIMTVGYRGDRIKAWLNPETSEEGYQTLQSLYAIGSGGLFGKGLGESIQKLGFLPESHNDMIFSVICEELGLFGAFAVIALFVMLVMNLRRIANASLDSYGGLLVTGVIAHIASQTILNMGVVTGLLPPTGVTLPFFSYGGTSLVFLLVEMGIVIGVSRQMRSVRSSR